MAGAYHAGHAMANIVQGLGLHPVSVPVDSLHSGVIVDHTRVTERGRRTTSISSMSIAKSLTHGASRRRRRWRRRRRNIVDAPATAPSGWPLTSPPENSR
jgi:hypothetical protein